MVIKEGEEVELRDREASRLKGFAVGYLVGVDSSDYLRFGEFLHFSLTFLFILFAMLH